MATMKCLKIRCTADEIKQLMKVYGVTKGTVYNALKYRNHSVVSRSIRSHAEKIFGHEPFEEEITI